MDSRRKLFRCMLVGVAALAVSLAVPVVVRADRKPKAAPPPKKAPASNTANGATLRFGEAETLRKAYITLAGANHDYNGHRAKAMASVHAAVRVLDDYVMKHGSAAQKSATKKETAAMLEAAKIAMRTPMFHKPQPASDAQLRQAGELLTQVRTTMAQNKQKVVLPHVEAAVREVGIGLTIR